MSHPVKAGTKDGKQRDIESMAQTGKILADIHWLGIITESDDEIEYQRAGCSVW